jgi:ketosteroid isomerase-like protein
MKKTGRGAMVLGLLIATRVFAAAAEDSVGIDAFNRAVIDATRRMDNAASLALWEDDGVSLLPNTPPLVGKPAIGAFLEKVMAQFPGAKMDSFTFDCATIALEGDFASERCVEHQIVTFSDGKPPFDGWGNILYVLHRRAGRWRIRAEMWNAAQPPAATR